MLCCVVSLNSYPAQLLMQIDSLLVLCICSNIVHASCVNPFCPGGRIYPSKAAGVLSGLDGYIRPPPMLLLSLLALPDGKLALVIACPDSVLIKIYKKLVNLRKFVGVL